ncbi:MAG: hypothetical protein WBX15_03520 [Thermoanaerobaculia bacterium]
MRGQKRTNDGWSVRDRQRQRPESRNRAGPERRDFDQSLRNLLRFHVLIHVFGGDARKWLEYLESRGTLRQRRDDVPFVRVLCHQIERNPGVLDGIRLVVANTVPPAAG